MAYPCTTAVLVVCAARAVRGCIDMPCQTLCACAGFEGLFRLFGAHFLCSMRSWCCKSTGPYGPMHRVAWSCTACIPSCCSEQQLLKVGKHAASFPASLIDSSDEDTCCCNACQYYL